MKGKINGQKGITLVALIITIVVLLILAVVAIGSIQEEGLVGKANGVVDKWDQAQGDEQGMLNSYESVLNQYGTNNSGGSSANLEIMKRYVLGKTGQGRSGLEIANVNMSTMAATSFKDDPESITDASTTVTIVSQGTEENGTKGIVYAKYKNTTYKIVVDMATFMTESVEVSKAVGASVAYDSNEDGIDEEWIVLTNSDGLVEIVSKNAMGSLTLGSGDKSVSGSATASYNNAIKTINDYCKSLVKQELRDKVRSVGGTDNTIKPASLPSGILGGMASTDEFYKTDYEKMATLGILSTNESYWIASRVAESFTYTNEDYSVRYVGKHNGLQKASVCSAILNLGIIPSSPSHAVRLIITNPDI